MCHQGAIRATWAGTTGESSPYLPVRRCGMRRYNRFGVPAIPYRGREKPRLGAEGGSQSSIRTAWNPAVMAAKPFRELVRPVLESYAGFGLTLPAGLVAYNHHDEPTESTSQGGGAAPAFEVVALGLCGHGHAAHVWRRGLGAAARTPAGRGRRHAAMGCGSRPYRAGFAAGYYQSQADPHWLRPSASGSDHRSFGSPRLPFWHLY